MVKGDSGLDLTKIIPRFKKNPHPQVSVFSTILPEFGRALAHPPYSLSRPFIIAVADAVVVFIVVCIIHLRLKYAGLVTDVFIFVFIIQLGLKYAGAVTNVSSSVLIIQLRLQYVGVVTDIFIFVLPGVSVQNSKLVEGRLNFFIYLTTHSKHFIYCYMV